jgi:deoxyribonuclease IV
VKNQRQWRAPALTDEQIVRFRQAQAETGLDPVVAHASYLLNLASPDRDTRERSVRALIDELERCEALGVSALIFHPGAHLDDSLNAGIRRIIYSLDEVNGACAGFATLILLETTAGQGSAIGWHFDHLSVILSGVRDPHRLGICLDTCHLFAAGHDFRTQAGYTVMMEEFDRSIGLKHVHCIHVNDSKRECGSRIDRHEHIGKGRIGKAGFAHFVNDPHFARVPFILETPKGKDGRGAELDKVNLNRLRKLVAT